MKAIRYLSFIYTTKLGRLSLEVSQLSIHVLSESSVSVRLWALVTRSYLLKALSNLVDCKITAMIHRFPLDNKLFQFYIRVYYTHTYVIHNSYTKRSQLQRNQRNFMSPATGTMKDNNMYTRSFSRIYLSSLQ